MKLFFSHTLILHRVLKRIVDTIYIPTIKLSELPEEIRKAQGQLTRSEAEKFLSKTREYLRTNLKTQTIKDLTEYIQNINRRINSKEIASQLLSTYEKHLHEFISQIESKELYLKRLKQAMEEMAAIQFPA